jgi:hypothetical protein
MLRSGGFLLARKYSWIRNVEHGSSELGEDKLRSSVTASFGRLGVSRG